MLHKTRGVVLKFIKYGETSIIAHIFTEELGLQAYIINGVRSKRSNKIALFQPLTLLDLVVYYNDKKNIHRIKEIKCNHAYENIPSNIKKSIIFIFLSEILSKVLKEGSETEGLFEFIYNSLIALDKIESNVENFHLIFLVKLSKYLGFSAESPNQIISEIKTYNPGLEEPDGTDFSKIFNASIASPIQISNASRRLILQILIDFYRNNVEGISEVKSVKILKEILN